MSTVTDFSPPPVNVSTTITVFNQAASHRLSNPWPAYFRTTVEFVRQLGDTDEGIAYTIEVVAEPQSRGQPHLSFRVVEPQSRGQPHRYVHVVAPQ
jgi:hypothetical protein